MFLSTVSTVSTKKQPGLSNTSLLSANQAGETIMKSAVMFCAFAPVLTILALSWMFAHGSLYIKEEWLAKVQPS
jgi:hypothetical protein